MSTFPIPEHLKAVAWITSANYQAKYRQSIESPDVFWASEAEVLLTWHKKWHTVKDTSFNLADLHINWFAGAQLNVCYNCVDRHLPNKADVDAIIWEPDSATEATRRLTYGDLQKEVCRAANMLLKRGVQIGDRVTIYMPMIPEAVIAMLACARIGAIHSVVFAGFSPAALNGRIQDSGSKIVITADEGVRGGKNIPLKDNVDQAVLDTDVHTVIVYKRTGNVVNILPGRDFYWQDLMQQVGIHHTVSFFDSETPLFILYTSGSTGKPKGLLHTTAGYLLYAACTFKYVFDYHDGDIYWCTADVGWITGHSYIVYGPLANGATVLMYEGVPTYPTPARYWQIVDEYKVNAFYSSPTALRTLIREGDNYVNETSRSSLKILGSVGEPINPEAWLWYYRTVGSGQCAIVDTWWQTETGGHMLTPFPGATNTKPGCATTPFFGVVPALMDANGKVSSQEGALCFKDSWPGQARTIWGDHNRFVETYFSLYPGYYFSGDAAKCDEDSYYWITGRMDDVINVSGHRISTAEVEAAINHHPKVTESAVVGFPHPIKGTGIYAFVITYHDQDLTDLQDEIRKIVKKQIGSLAVPEKIQVVEGLPKTRSGKIMRRILRKIASGEVRSSNDLVKLGDISTLLNPEDIIALIAKAV